MGLPAILTLVVLALVMAALARSLAGPDLVLLAGVAVLLGAGVLTPGEAFAGFANPGVLTIAALLVVAAGVRETGGLDLLAHLVLGHPKRLVSAQIRLMTPVALLSAFVGNTALVAMGIPIVLDWAKRLGRSPSKLLMPLSYAAILGGTTTLIGTSTNLVVAGMAAAAFPELHLGFFDVATVGLPVLLAGLVYVWLASPFLLPDRGRAETALERVRDYSVVMRVEPGSPLGGRSLEAAGLRHLPGLFLAEIERGGLTLPAVRPDTVLAPGDLLRFVGMVESVADLRRFPGLALAEEQTAKLQERRPERCLVEAVVSGSSPLVGRTVRASRFRTRFDAAIVAVHRHGARIHAKVGDIVLEAGDTLLLEAHPTFPKLHRYDPDFLLVSEVEGSKRPRRERAFYALAVLAAVVVTAAFGWLPLLTAALLGAGAMLLGRALGGNEAREALDLRLLIAIASAFGLGMAVQKTGLAALAADALVPLAASWGPVALLGAIYLLTALVTEIMTNAAAAAVVFPVAAGAARAAGLPLEPFLYVLMVAASASFVTPIGYQTNLMVFGPGGYRFGDYVRFGLPLAALTLVVAVTSAAVFWL